MKSVEVRKAINAQDVANQASAEVVATLSSVLLKKETVHLALTGGTVGILTLEVLAKDLTESAIDLSKVHFWWGDERFVESYSVERNSLQAERALLGSLNLPQSNVHAFPSSVEGLDLETARDEFAKHVSSVFEDQSPKMDLTLLGMGPDGHVASLFPGQSHPGEWVVAVPDSPKPPPARLSFSMEMINRSEKIMFVVAGIDKAEAVEAVHKDPSCELPAAKVSAQGETLWIIDEAAGAAFWSC